MPSAESAAPRPRRCAPDAAPTSSPADARTPPCRTLGVACMDMAACADVAGPDGARPDGARPGVSCAPALTDAVVWSHGGRLRVGLGGATVLLTGPDRLRRLSALWRRAVAGRPDPRAHALAWVSSVFDDSSTEPSLLRVPARVVEVPAAGAGTRRVPLAPPLDALADALAQDPQARLAPGGHVPLPAPGAAAWDDAGYAGAVREVLERMAASGGRLGKVVISRTDTVPADEPALWAALDALREAYPQTWVFAVGGLLGATPEMLAVRRRGEVSSRVLAGSLPRGANPAEDARLRARLAEDPRLGDEHAWAARSVLDALAPVLALEDPAPRPHVLTLPNVHHLATDVRGRQRSSAGTVLDVVAALHPTAAVGGTPRQEALAVIRELEPVDRGRYAGPVGWLDETGDGEIALALRCGQQVPGGVRLQAGGGIVPGADAAEEVAEVAAKLLPMRRALGLG
ncbi:chorismate-binding protein [Micrococcus sp.]|uniref:isochorismate synthase n=1 Tax=Micrococcus sp. TaxID=1271 RepID=UPI002A91878D|nr:chorismate-binding protein [Micrococcus sp.]MDY6054990.1 chorismate-binding protein [Micrococcus sp.]